MSALGTRKAHQDFEMSTTSFQLLNKLELSFVYTETVRRENSQNGLFLMLKTILKLVLISLCNVL